jgi:predicted enzyme related to lactoylglutathione lyase
MSTQVQTAVGRFVWHDHVSGDPAEGQDFYGKLFGWETEVFKPGEIDYPMITANGQTHGGFGPAQGGAPPHWLGHVLVDDVDAAAERARGAGGTVLSEPMDIPDVGRFAVLRDPQGAVFSVFAAKGEATVPEGVFVWDELVTTDIEGAKRFYGDVVGWSSTDMDNPNGQGSYTIFGTGEQQRAGAMQRPQGVDAPPHWMLYVGSADVDADAKKAKGLGAQVYMEPFDVPTVGRLAILADPTGAAFGLFRPEQS